MIVVVVILRFPGESPFQVGPSGADEESPGWSPAEPRVPFQQQDRALHGRTTLAGTDYVAFRVTVMGLRGVLRRLQGATSFWTVYPGFRGAPPRAILVCPAGASMFVLELW